ncbi:hypothetical protein Gotur_013445 [Gossypium turneri]
MDGFSAVLSQAHLDQLHELPGHLATYPETIGHLHTTRAPTFLGLKKHSGLWPAGKYSKAKFQLTVEIDVGVGSIPESDYFGNYGFLSWYEVNGKHQVTSPIVSAFAP